MFFLILQSICPNLPPPSLYFALQKEQLTPWCNLILHLARLEEAIQALSSFQVSFQVSMASKITPFGGFRVAGPFGKDIMGNFLTRPVKQ